MVVTASAQLLAAAVNEHVFEPLVRTWDHVITRELAAAAHRGNSTATTPPSPSCPMREADVVLVYLRVFAWLASYLVGAVVAAVLLRMLYEVMFVPFNRVKLMHEIGYQGSKSEVTTKRDVANLVRKRRRVGERLPPVYPNGWFQLCDSLFVGVGQVKEITALGEHFAVYRSKSGKAYVLDAYCPHMGSNLAVGGIVKDECLQCPFHGWVFEGIEGKCVDIPYSDKAPPKTAKTRAWSCKEQNGGIFIWFHCDGAEPEWTIPVIDDIANGRYQYRGRVEHHINTHIQDIPENGSDLAHLEFLHIPNVMSGVDLADMHNSIWNCVQHIFKVQAKGSPEGQPHVCKFLLQHYLLVLHKWKLLNLDFTVYQIGPGTVHLHFTSSFGEGMLVQTLTPVEPLHQVLVHRLYTNWMLPLWAGRIFLTLEAMQVDRDVMVWNNKTFKARPLLVKQDQLISTYRRWFSQFYSDNSPTLESLQQVANTTLDW